MLLNILIFLKILDIKILIYFFSSIISMWLTVYLQWIYETLLLLMEDKGFNVTQGMALLLLKPLNMPSNYVLNLIIYITNPRNNIGY